MSKKATVCSSTGGGAAKFSAFPALLRRNARVTRTGDAAKRDLDTRSAALVSLAALHGYFAIADRGGRREPLAMRRAIDTDAI